MEEMKTGFKGKIPEEIFEALADNRCILFVGAGLSQGVKRSNGINLPGWDKLLLEMIDWMEKNLPRFNDQAYIEELKGEVISDKTDTLLYVAQELKDQLTPFELVKFLRSVFRDDALQPTITHDLLPLIPFKAILTTNYDKLIESAYYNVRKTVPVYTQEELTSPLKEFCICKLHGDIDRPDNVILGYEDYDRLIHDNPQYEECINNLLLNNVVIFVGYSANDPELNLILENNSIIFGRKNQKHYIL